MHLITPFAKAYKKWDTWYTARKLQQKWDRTYAIELAKMSTEDQSWYKVLVDNQLKSIRTQGMFKSSGINDDQQLIIFRVGCTAARHLKQLKNIVGLQPIEGPVGMIFHMGFTEQPGENESRRMSLAIEKYPVTAGSRRTQAKWALEAVQDMSAVHLGNTTIEDEMITAIGAEIASEIIAEVLSDLRALGQRNSRHDNKIAQSVDAFDVTKIGTTINAVCNAIASDTRRGVGNFVIGSPAFICMLQAGAKAVFAPALKTVETEPTVPNYDLKLVGYLNGTIKVYSSLHLDNDVIVGYKGNNTDTDAGYIYSPYVPVISTGVVVVPTTFAPVVNFMTRYGKWSSFSSQEEFKSSATSDKYYRTFKEPAFNFLDTLDYHSETVSNAIPNEEVIPDASNDQATQPSVDNDQPSVDNKPNE